MREASLLLKTYLGKESIFKTVIAWVIAFSLNNKYWLSRKK